MLYFFNISSLLMEFCEVKKMYECLIKFGDVEKFYFNFYLSIVLNLMKVFEGLLRYVVILFIIKVVDCMLV